MAIVRNLATVKTTADITSSATSIPVNRVDVFGTSQTTLDNPFYVTIMPASGDEPANLTNSEIVLVTGISGSNLTVTRGQRSTTAKAFNSGAIVTMAIYAEDAVLLGDGGTDVGTPAPCINTSDIKNGAITTGKIADGAVTKAKINFSTFKPYWKTIATSTSSNVTLPAGYRFYRVHLVGEKTNANNWGVISCPQVTGTTWIYIQGMSNGTWVANERSVTASSDKAVMDGARSGTQNGFQTWDITISKPDKTGSACIATWETGMTGSLTFNTGRSIFNVTNGTADMNLNCELSPAFWSVEVLEEN